MSVLIAIIFFIFGCLVSWLYMDGKLKNMRLRVEHEQRLREYMIDQQIGMFKGILEDIGEIKK